MTTELLETGVDVVGHMPWGTHCCLFYETPADLIELLASYCHAGLRRGEFCLCVVAAPLAPAEARLALSRLIPDFERYESSIEVVAARDWYLRDNVFDMERVVAGWHDKLARATERGYSGIRVAGDAAWLESHQWKAFRDYEDALNESIVNRRMSVLCTYSVGACGAAEVLDVVGTHQFAVAKRHGCWDMIETAGHKQAKTEIARLNNDLERRVAERTRQLRRSEAFLREAQRLTRAGSFGWIPSTGELIWSAETYRIFEYDLSIRPTVDMVMGRIHPEDRPGVEELLERASREGGDWNMDHRLRMPDGSTKHIHVVSHAVSDDSSAEVSFVGAVMDITERKLADTRLRQAEKMEALGRFAGGIAHDFNNVLGGIVGYGEMLFEETPADSGLKRYSQNVLTAANRGRELVEQILAYSRSQRSKHVPVDLARVVAEALDLVRGALAADVRLEARVQPGPLPVMGDATQLHQVAMNLCVNALQAMGSGGTLTVSLADAHLAEERECQHGSLAPGSHVVLTIEDTGAGMDEATLERIFEPFFTTKDAGKGIGLGLALVFGIVRSCGGAIDVRSELGRGSAFTLHFPRVDAPVESDAREKTPPRGRGERVVLVENEETILAVTCEVLARLGYAPCTFSDSRAALAELEAHAGEFDALITDEAMPGLAGTELAEQVQRRWTDLPVLLMSGFVGPTMAERAAAAGVTEILKKPVRSRDLAAALARALGR